MYRIDKYNILCISLGERQICLNMWKKRSHGEVCKNM